MSTGCSLMEYIMLVYIIVRWLLQLSKQSWLNIWAFFSALLPGWRSSTVIPLHQQYTYQICSRKGILKNYYFGCDNTDSCVLLPQSTVLQSPILAADLTENLTLINRKEKIINVINTKQNRIKKCWYYVACLTVNMLIRMSTWSTYPVYQADFTW